MVKKQFERIDNSCADISLDAVDYNSDKDKHLIARDYDPESEHPSPEELLIREAVKWLTPKQRAVWEYYTYDRFTQDEIAQKLGKKRTTIETQIKQCETRIAKWCRSNMIAYNLLKESMKDKK